MKQIPKTSPKKIGRPKLPAPSIPLMLRMHPPQVKAIDRWRRDDISRQEAIRQLVAIALNRP
jgi:hypothetical protein